MNRLYIYVVDRDLGFAPNPFHGYCTLATCKPDIRNTARVDDWILGVGGRRLKATGRCVYAMKVTKKMTYNDYWYLPDYIDKKPVRNGSQKMLLGDNIYNWCDKSKIWQQAHSHHSLYNGDTNNYNLIRDTKSNKVLLSDHFYYFGKSAPSIPHELLAALSYKNKVGHRVFTNEAAFEIITWIETEYKGLKNLVLADPFNFDKSEAHYSVKTNKITAK